jgi:HAD superfamily hydrolase (TIGR01549 family)
MYSTVIFDMDGTLIDSDTNNMLSLQKAILHVDGKDVPIDMVKKVSGMPGMRCLEFLGVEKREETLERWDIEYFKLKNFSDYFGGMEETLLALKEKGVYTGIVTSRSADEYDSFFAHLGLEEKFDLVIYSSDTQNHKPHPEPILTFLQRANRGKSGAIYIGDTIYDRDAAIGAGIDFAFAGWSAHEVEAKMVLDHPSDVLSLVE